MLKFLTSTIFAKVVMAATGLIVVGFLFMHAIGNLQFFIGAEHYNAYAAFLQAPFGLREFLWILRGFLILCIILHIISAVYLRIYNNAAKPNHYKVKKYVKSKLTARTMLWTGILIFMGLILHLLHFTVGSLDFKGGYNSYEIVQTEQFAVDLNSNSNLSSHHSNNHAACPNFANSNSNSKENSCEAVITSKQNGEISISFRGDVLSADDYTKLTGKKLPEVLDESENVLQEVNDALVEAYKLTNNKQMEGFGKNFEILFADNVSVLEDANGNIAIREGNDKGNLIATFEKHNANDKKGYSVVIEPNYEYSTGKSNKDVTIEHPNGKEIVTFADFFGKFPEGEINEKGINSKLANSNENCPDCANNSSGKLCENCQKLANSNEKISPVVKERRDVYKMVTTEFSSIGVALFYILFVILVGFHLNHAIQSSIHTLGIEGPKFTPVLQIASIVLSCILVLLFISLPLYNIAKTLLGCLGINLGFGGL